MTLILAMLSEFKLPIRSIQRSRRVGRRFFRVLCIFGINRVSKPGILAGNGRVSRILSRLDNSR